MARFSYADAYGQNFGRELASGPISPGDDLSTEATDAFSKIPTFNQALETEIGASAIKGKAKWEQAKIYADAYKARADAEAKAKSRGGWGDILGAAGSLFGPIGSAVGSIAGGFIG